MTVVFMAVTAVIAVAGMGVFYSLAMQPLMDEFQRRLEGIASTTALGIDGDLHETLKSAEQEGSGTHVAIRQRLEAVRRANRANRISDLYTLRLQGDGVVFVVDSYAPNQTQIDFAKDSKTEAPPGIGEAVDDVTPEMRETLTSGRPTAETRLSNDKWGTWLSAYAPIHNHRGEVVGAVGVDASAETVATVRAQFVAGGLLAIATAALLAGLIGLGVSRSVTGPVHALMTGVQALRGGDFDARVSIQSGDEFEDLGEAFNEMVHRVREGQHLRGALVRHLSLHVAERILERPGLIELGGQRLDVSVLFADIRSFTQATEGMGPHEIVATLNEYFGVIVDIVLQEDGMLDKFLGDGLMAVFGAPLPQADHAQRAVRCALAMQEAMDELNAGRGARGLPQMHLGIGISSGEVVAGQVGSRRRLEYTVIGQEVSRAARLQSVAGPGETILSEASAARIRNPASVEDVGLTMLKGFTRPEQVYRALPQRQAA